MSQHKDSESGANLEKPANPPVPETTPDASSVDAAPDTVESAAEPTVVLDKPAEPAEAPAEPTEQVGDQPAEQVAAQADELAGQAADTQLTDWLRSAQSTAQVKVDPTYGTFDPSSFSVVAPGSQSSAPASTDSTAPPASSLDSSSSVAPSSSGP